MHKFIHPGQLWTALLIIYDFKTNNIFPVAKASPLYNSAHLPYLTPLPFLLWFLPEYTDLDIMVRAGMTLVYARWLSGQLYVERSPPLMIMPVGQHDRQFGSIAQSAKHCPNNSIDSDRQRSG
jgi:hypothetical protein